METTHKFCLLLISGLFFFSLACGLSEPATERPTETPAALVKPPAETTEEPPDENVPPTATLTPVPDVIGEDGCTLQAAFVADVTVPDDTVMASGETFEKTWRLRNSGTCTWEAGTQLVFVGGEPLEGPPSISLGSVAPNQTLDVSGEFRAPTAAGTYRSDWRLQAPDGTRFGGIFFIRIVVAAAEPTATPTEEPTAEPSPEPGPPDLVVANLEIDTDDPRQGMPMNVVATLRNNGERAAESVRWAWRLCPTCEFIEAPGVYTLQPGEQVVASMEYTFAGWSTYTTEAWVDSRETVAESNEENNRRQLVIPVKAGKPDLIITSVTYDPNPPVQNQPTGVRVVVTNQGSKEAGAFRAEWWSSITAPDPRCTWNVAGGLAVGESKTLSCSYTYPSWYGTITTRAIADIENVIDELDESNNRLDVQTPVHRP